MARQSFANRRSKMGSAVVCAHVMVPFFLRARRRAPPKAARASRARGKGDHNMGAAVVFRAFKVKNFYSIFFSRAFLIKVSVLLGQMAR